MKTNIFGITDKSYTEIVAILKALPNLTKVIVFGSRSLGNFKNGSDIDLALVFDKKIDFLEILKLKAKFENSYIIPYRVDIIDYNNIDNPKLKQHIDEFGIELKLN